MDNSCYINSTTERLQWLLVDCSRLFSSGIISIWSYDPDDPKGCVYTSLSMERQIYSVDESICAVLCVSCSSLGISKKRI